MSQFVVYSANSKSNVNCVLNSYSRQLILPFDGPGGWGLGYYNSGELLSRVEPSDGGQPLDVSRQLDNLEAVLFVLHSREATVGSVRRENTHPFRFQNWAFAHNGTLVGFADYVDRIRESMPPFILRRIKGDTDSEMLFHLFLSFLYDSGDINRINPGTAKIRGALTQALSMVDQFALERDHPVSMSSAVVSDGYSVVILGRGVPVHYALVEGIASCECCRPSRVQEGQPSPIDHSKLRAVLVRSCKSADTLDGFQTLDDGHILSITSDHLVEFNEFR